MKLLARVPVRLVQFHDDITQSVYGVQYGNLIFLAKPASPRHAAGISNDEPLIFRNV